MATNCLFCKQPFHNGANGIKLVGGKIYGGKYGGFQFKEDEEFSTQGFAHFECFYKAVIENRKKHNILPK